MGLADVPTGAGIHKPLSLTHSRPNAALRELVKNAEYVGNSINATEFTVRLWTLSEFCRELGLPDRAPNDLVRSGPAPRVRLGYFSPCSAVLINPAAPPLLIASSDLDIGRRTPTTR